MKKKNKCKLLNLNTLNIWVQITILKCFKIENLLYASFLATSGGIFYHWQIRKMQTQTCGFASYQANCMQNFCREQNEIT